MALELAKAYVQIIPSAQGMEGSIASALSGESTSAGQESGKGFASSMASALKKGIVGLGIGKAVVDAVSSGSEFESAMAKARTLFSGSDSEFDALSNTIMGLSSTYGVSAAGLAEAAYSAESASVPMEMLGEMLERSTMLAQAGFTDVETALSATAKTMNAYGDAAGSIEDVQRVLIQTQNLGITTVGELGASLAQVTPTAAAMGVSFDQVGAAMALMTAKGTPTAQTTTQLRSAFAELGKSGTKGAMALEAAAEGSEYAGMSFTEMMANGATLGDVFGMMQDYADASGLSMVDLWSSIEAGNAAMMIAADVETFEKDLEAMGTTADVVGDGYQTMAGTFSSALERMKTSAKNLGIAITTGMDVGAAFQSLTTNIGDLANNLIDMAVTSVTGIFQNLPSIFEGVVSLGSRLLQSLSGVNWGQVGTSIWNGVTGVIDLAGDWLFSLFTTAMTAISNISWSDVGSAIKTGVSTIITVGGEWLSGLFEKAKTAVGTVDWPAVGQSIYNGVTTIITIAGDWLKSLFDTALSAITGITWSDVGNAIKTGVTSIITVGGDWLKNLFDAGKGAAESLGWSALGTKIKTGVSGILETGGNFLKKIFDAGRQAGIDADWASVGSAIQGAVESIGSFIKNIFTAPSGDEVTTIETDWKTIGETLNTALQTALAGSAQLISGIFDAGTTAIANFPWEEVGGKLGELAGQIAKFEIAAISGVFSAGQSAIEAFPWEDVGTKIGQLAGQLAGLVGDAIGGVFSAGQSAIEAFPWEDVGTKLGQLAGQVATIELSAISGAFSAGQSAIEAFPWEDVGTKIGQLAGQLTGIVGDAISGVFTAGSSAINSFPWADIGSKMGTLYGDLTQIPMNALSGIFESAETAINRIDWSGLGDTIYNGLSRAWGIVSGLGDVALGLGEGIVQAGQSGVDALKTWIASWNGNGSEETQAQSMIEGVTKSISEGQGDAVQAAEEAVKEIVGKFETGLSSDVGSAIGTTVITGLNTGMSSMGGPIKTTVNTITAGIDGEFKAKDWNQTGSDIISRVKKGMEGAASTLAGAVTTLMNSVDTAFKNHDWISIGTLITNGLSTGILNGESTVVNAADKVATAVVNKLNDKLKIASPSRVTMQMGEYVGLGLAEGIESTAGRVQRAMATLSTLSQPTYTSPWKGTEAEAAAASGSASGGRLQAVIMMDKSIVGSMVSPVVNRQIGSMLRARR